MSIPPPFPVHSPSLSGPGPVSAPVSAFEPINRGNHSQNKTAEGKGKTNVIVFRVHKNSKYAAVKESVLKHIPSSKLHVSQPDPSGFGNPPNESDNVHWTRPNWLESRYHFAFAEYSNLLNLPFGALRVLNDDLIQPKRGFANHPHKNVEIVTYVVQGSLTHQDSMGAREILGRDSIQFMTAGSGITHSEKNLHQNQTLRVIQMWFKPKIKGLKPNYGSVCGKNVNIEGKLAHIVAPVDSKAVVPARIHCDVNIYVGKILGKERLGLYLAEDRQAYYLTISGNPHVSYSGTQQFSIFESAEVYGPGNLELSGTSHVLIIEMRKDGSGRGDLT